jgi:predicted MPP superfamily phosphohydrolase
VGAAACGWTFGVEPHWLEVVRRPLLLRGLPSFWQGRTLALLADLHIGPQVADDYLLETFARVAALEPDIVAVAGDVTSFHHGVFDHAARILDALPRGRVATVGVLGNHDYGPNWAHPEVADQLAEILAGAGVSVLRNQLLDLDGLALLGLDDLWARRFALEPALSKLPPARAAIALCHNPDAVDLAGWDSFAGWIFAGHTHGGQCKPPFLPPPLLPVTNRRYTAGAFDLANGRNLYISRGVGHLLGVRFNVRPEVTLFELGSA